MFRVGDRVKIRSNVSSWGGEVGRIIAMDGSALPYDVLLDSWKGSRGNGAVPFSAYELKLIEEPTFTLDNIKNTLYSVMVDRFYRDYYNGPDSAMDMEAEGARVALVAFGVDLDESIDMKDRAYREATAKYQSENLSAAANREGASES